MRRLNVCLAVGILPVMVACASSGPVTLSESVGPQPLNAQTETSAKGGVLKVYSLAGNYNAEGVNYHPHTDYVIQAGDGTARKLVRNAEQPHEEEPVALQLPAGSYVVEALADGYVRTRVPVVIASGRMTAVYLEAGDRPGMAKAATDSWVRTPEGLPVGWRAETSTAAVPPAVSPR